MINCTRQANHCCHDGNPWQHSIEEDVQTITTINQNNVHDGHLKCHSTDLQI